MRYLKQNLLLPIDRDERGACRWSWPTRVTNSRIKALTMASGLKISPCVGIASEIENGIEKLFGGGRSQMGQIVDRLGGATKTWKTWNTCATWPPRRRLSAWSTSSCSAPSKRVPRIFTSSRSKTASRCVTASMACCRRWSHPPARSTAAVISRIKIMANLNIAERRLPQDGRIMHRVQGKELDLRVSTVPTSHGESVVMRILDRESIVLSFDSLGFDDMLQ